MPEVDLAIRRRFVEALRRGNFEQRGPLAEPTRTQWDAITRPGTAAGKPARASAPELAPVFK